MSRVLLSLVALPLLASCTEHWHAWDSAELDLSTDELIFVDAVVTTSPSAWPDELYDHAVRVGRDGASVRYWGEVIDGELIAGPRALDDHLGDHVNLLDAWHGCERDQVCERRFRFATGCPGPEPCSDRFTADAFLASHGLRAEDEAPDALRLSLELAHDGGDLPRPPGSSPAESSPTR